jgi:hypothetical protein
MLGKKMHKRAPFLHDASIVDEEISCKMKIVQISRCVPGVVPLFAWLVESWKSTGGGAPPS